MFRDLLAICVAPAARIRQHFSTSANERANERDDKHLTKANDTRILMFDCKILMNACIPCRISIRWPDFSRDYLTRAVRRHSADWLPFHPNDVRGEQFGLGSVMHRSLAWRQGPSLSRRSHRSRCLMIIIILLFATQHDSPLSHSNFADEFTRSNIDWIDIADDDDDDEQRSLVGRETEGA